MKKSVFCLLIATCITALAKEPTIVGYEINDYSRFNISGPVEASRSVANEGYNLKQEIKNQMKDEEFEFDDPFSPPHTKRNMQFWKFKEQL